MSKRVITAKFNSECAETGKTIKKGDLCIYDPIAKKVYAVGSPTHLQYMKDNPTKRDQGGDMLDASIEQAAERWYHQTYPYND